MNLKQTPEPSESNSELAEQNRSWNLLFSVPWLTVTCFFFCLLFICIGMDNLSVVWGGDPSNSIWSSFGQMSILFGVMFGLLWMFCSTLRRSGLGKKYRPPKKTKYAGTLLGVSFVLMIVGIFIPMLYFSIEEVKAEDLGQQEGRALNQPWVEHQVPGSEFTFHTPSNWRAIDGPGGWVQLINQTSELTVLVQAVAKVDTTVKSLSELQESTLKSLKQNGYELKSIDKRNVGARVDHLCLDVNLGLVKEATKTNVFVRQIDFPNHWITAFFEVRPSDLQEKTPTMMRIADSVWYPPQRDYILSRYEGVFQKAGEAKPHSMQMYFFENQNGRVSGVMNWPDLDNTATRFKGTVVGTKLTLSEYEILAGNGRVVPVEHTATMNPSTINGTATHKGTASTYSLKLVDRP